MSSWEGTDHETTGTFAGRPVYFVVNAGGILPRVLGFPDFREPEKKDKKEAPPLSPPKSAVPTL